MESGKAREAKKGKLTAGKIMTIDGIKKGESDSLEFKREFPDKGKNVITFLIQHLNIGAEIKGL
ncbi:MAG: hypothetical protein IJU95_08690 [Treponema sp.]|nr:hypothetical protein [Treponema sp.]